MTRISPAQRVTLGWFADNAAKVARKTVTQYRGTPGFPARPGRQLLLRRPSRLVALPPRPRCTPVPVRARSTGRHHCHRPGARREIPYGDQLPKLGLISYVLSLRFVWLRIA